MTGIKLEVDGQWYEPKDLAWIEIAPCGCLDGVMTVRDRFTPESAWDDLHESESKAYSDWMRKLGFRIELVTMEAYRAMSFAECEHDPRYGIPTAPTPDGMEWRIMSGHFAKKADRSHLFAPRADGMGRLAISALCSKVQDYGNYEADNVGGHFRCAACESRAEAILAKASASDVLPPAEGVLL